MGMVVTQALQWAAVLIAMYLLTVSTVEQSLSANATGLMLLTVLALGVFVSGLDLRSWKLCLTGAFLAVAVPAIAWIQQAALLLLLIGLALIGLLFLYWWLRDRRAPRRDEAHSANGENTTLATRAAMARKGRGAGRSKGDCRTAGLRPGWKFRFPCRTAAAVRGSGYFFRHATALESSRSRGSSSVAFNTSHEIRCGDVGELRRLKERGAPRHFRGQRPHETVAGPMRRHDSDRLRGDPERRIVGRLHDEPVPAQRDDHAAAAFASFGSASIAPSRSATFVPENISASTRFTISTSTLSTSSAGGSPRRRCIEDHDGAATPARLRRRRY